MDTRPYVGITGFNRKEEVKIISQEFMDCGFNGNGPYTGMLGFLVSEKRLAEKDWAGKLAPAAKDLPLLTKSVPATLLPMLHYYTAHQETLFHQVKELLQLGDMYGQGYCRAVQLNVNWPSPVALEQLKTLFPELQFVLQLPRRALFEKTISEIEQALEQYQQIVEYALIDLSGGKGILFDTVFSLDLMHCVHAALPNAYVGIAGGLSESNVEAKLLSLQKQYPLPFCIDAQGQLRAFTESLESRLDMAKATSYIQRAALILRMELDLF